MTTPGSNERFSRQIILPSVGGEGQKKWEAVTILLAGEGNALQSAKTALETVGVSHIILLDPKSPDPFPSSAITLIVTEDSVWRRRLSRQSRAESRPVLFAWPSGSGFALFFSRHQAGRCPCVECFEVMNPKAFSTHLRQGSGGQEGYSSVRQILGAMAASEALQWVLQEESPLENKVWINSLEEGISFHHSVNPSYKCPALLIEEGVGITP